MNYTDSDAYATHVATGHRMHQDAAAVTTQVTAKDLNMVIWSLMQVLIDAGIAPATFDANTPATYNRLSLAIQALAGGGAQSLTTNGYKQLPGGLIIQWGTYTADVVGDNVVAAVAFPIPFPTACLNAQVTTRNPSPDTNADAIVQVQGFSTTTLSANTYWVSGSGSVLAHGFTWFAIGY